MFCIQNAKRRKEVSYSKIEQSDLSKPIYEQVKAMILSQELKPGQKIVQEKLSAQLGVSRTPLAKALQMLEFELLVESKPRRGMFVKNIDLLEMRDVFECREVLEALAVRKIAEQNKTEVIQRLEALFNPFMQASHISNDEYAKADEAFHQIIIEESGNAVLQKMFVFGSIHDKIIQIGLVRPPEETLEEHIQIIKALKDNKPEEAAKAAALHVRKSCELINQEILKAKK